LITGLYGFTTGLSDFRQERVLFLIEIHLLPPRGWKGAFEADIEHSLNKGLIYL
jgi:hypothetical protein